MSHPTQSINPHKSAKHPTAAPTSNPPRSNQPTNQLSSPALEQQDGKTPPLSLTEAIDRLAEAEAKADRLEAEIGKVNNTIKELIEALEKKDRRRGAKLRLTAYGESERGTEEYWKSLLSAGEARKEGWMSSE